MQHALSTPARRGRSRDWRCYRSIGVVIVFAAASLIAYVSLMVDVGAYERNSVSVPHTVNVAPSVHNRHEEQPFSTTGKHLAYMLYATNDIYACAALHLMLQLVHKVHMNTSRIDLVVLHSPDVSQAMIERIQQKLNVRTIPVDTILSANHDPTWRQSLTKLQAFRAWGYDRVVYLDADSVPLQNLDHLFDLPPASLYAPRAYWLEQPFFASTLMVIEPSTDLFDAMIDWARARGAAAGFDMDILNAYFSDRVEYLPGDYTILNSDFRARPDAKRKLYASTTALKKHTKLVHFSCKPDGSYGKPWTASSRDLSFAVAEGFDPLFASLFQEFWSTEDRYC